MLNELLHTTGFRYLALADTIEKGIRTGVYRAGEKLPSIRQLRAKTRLSISTVSQALFELEKRGIVDSRPKSGYYVRPLLENVLPAPQTHRPGIMPNKVTINNLAFAVMEVMGDPDILQLGGSVMAPELMPLKELSRGIKSASLDQLAGFMATYENTMGHLGLRRQIAQRYMELIRNIGPEQILITNGCFDAVAICLQSVATHGDIIIVESPTFPWYLQLIEDLHMLALEIPTDPREGIDLEQLEKALTHHAVKAAIFNSNFQNPLGFLPSDNKKRAIVRLFNQKKIPIIEDDIYGELYFGRTRPTTLKSFDDKDLVLYCSSFSKTLSPGLRVGWCIPGAFLENVKRRKLYVSIASPTLTQEILARYLKSGHFDRHLRRLRTALQRQMADMTLAVARYFPKNTRISTPKGGLTIWVQLTDSIDSLELFRQALAAKIAVLPGIICANTDSYRHCIRLSCGLPFDETLDRGVRTLAAICVKMGV
jgi:DNA-binding transcriptional MocR family regulator